MTIFTTENSKKYLWNKIKSYVGNGEGDMLTIGKETPIGGAILELAREISQDYPDVVNIDDSRIYIRHKLLTA